MHVIFEGAGVSRMQTPSLAQRLILSWGKLRRFYLVNFRPRYVEESLKRRVGNCHRTGACCYLVFGCPMLRWLDDLPLCRIYRHRPSSCTTFPIDERDLRDRDILSPGEPCGFSFLPPGETLEKAEEPRHIEMVLH